MTLSYYRSVPQIRPPSRISPPAFLAQSIAEVFYPAHKPPTPEQDSYSSHSRKII